jgi:D-glycero-alpha-D-manno-heptose-7-phosphate kinase
MILARAPLRISLGGGGTDLPSYYKQYGGFILSAAINKYVYIYVNKPAADQYLRIKYSQYEQVSSVDLIKHDLVRPALQKLKVEGAIEIVSMADVPDGTGLGSSGSYLVGLLVALYELRREKVPTQAVAELACHIEMDLAGHPVGKHDHYLAAFGGVTCLEISTDGKVKVTPLDMSIGAAEDFRTNVLLFYTGVTRSSRDILEDQRKGTVAGNTTMVDSLTRTKEIGYRVKEALEKGDIEQFGVLLDEHWQNKKRRSSKIAEPAIEDGYETAKKNGAVGGKIMGAGGGGFFMFYCPNSHKSQLRKALTARGWREMPYDFDFQGAKVLVNF